MKICVYGSADNFPENVTKEARKLGELIGKSGHTLTYGGFGDGLMVEVANGVSDTKGKILAVTPYFMGKEIYDSIKGNNKLIWTVEDSEHTDMWLDYNQEYRDKVTQLMEHASC